MLSAGIGDGSDDDEEVDDVTRFKQLDLKRI